MSIAPVVQLHGEAPDPGRRLWHVTVTLAGPSLEPAEVRAALERLVGVHSFLLSGRYAADRAEVRFWDEAEHVREAATRGLMLWADNVDAVALPPWDVVGLEVVDRDTFHKRAGTTGSGFSAVEAGAVDPF